MFNAKYVIYSYIKLPFDYDGVCSVINQHALLETTVDGYTCHLTRQHSPCFALPHYFCVCRGDAANASCIVCGFFDELLHS